MEFAMDMKDIKKVKAVLIYTTNEATDDRIDEEMPEGILYYSVSARKAVFECEEPYFLEEITGIDIKEETVEIYTEDEKWVFSTAGNGNE